MSELSDEDKCILRFMIDLEDKGSLWPDLARIAKGVGYVTEKCKAVLDELTRRGFTQIHEHVDPTICFSITRVGRARYFESVSEET